MVTLVAGDLRLVLAPQIGGSIARFDRISGEQRQPILRGADEVESPLEAACFPLVPYCNRIRDGRFTFRGRVVTIRANMPGDRSPLHGQGWLAPWRVQQDSASDADLAYDHPAGEWPWTYHARQRFTLDPQGLAIELSCTNLDPAPMPCGLGLHPYFPCSAETRLATAVANVWTVDDQILPVEKIAARGRYDLSGGAICARGLDNGYDGWSGEALIAAPPHRIRLSSPDARFFQLYSPAQGELFVAEPVSHANAALNAPEPSWDALGLRVLAPGETMRLRMRLDVGDDPSG